MLSRHSVFADAAPVISGLAPSSGPITGGQTVTITGSNFVAGDTVTIDGVVATGVTVVSATQITATVPSASDIHPANVVVTDSSSQASAPATYQYALPPPTLSSISPANGPIAGGTAVTITGSGFTLPNSTSNTWVSSGNTLVNTTAGPSVAVIGSTMYMYGGNTGGSGWSSAIATASTSDPTTWTASSKTLPAPLGNSSLAVIGTSMYLFGGTTTGGAYTNVIYTASTSDPTTWTDTGKTLPASFGISQLAVIGNHIYLFGGYNGSTAIANIYTASTSDPTTWTQAGTLPTPLQQSQLAVIGDNLYLFGGQTASATTGSIYTASTSDPTTWTDTGKTLPTQLWGSRLVVIGNSLYLIGGGIGGGAYTNNIYSASSSDPTTWTATGKTMPVAVRSGVASVIGNALYYFGGYDGSALRNTISSTPVTHVYPNQYNPSWATDWYTDTSGTAYNYGLTFGGVQATQVSLTDATHLTAVTPANASFGAVDVQASTYDGVTSNTLAGAYTYNTPAPTVSSVSPNSGVAGDVVDIFGSGFDNAATVQFGSTAANVTWIDATHLQAIVPATVYGGTVSVSVTNPGSTTTTLSNAFSYIGGTVTWTGATSTDWNTASNWDAGFVPGPNENVVINGGTHQPTINLAGGSVTVNSVTLGSTTASTLTEQNGSATNELITASDFSVGAEGTLTHTTNTTTQVNIVSLSVGGTLSVAAGGNIITNGDGYAKSSGTGAGGNGGNGSSYGGGSYYAGGGGGGGGFSTVGAAGGSGGGTGTPGKGGASYTGSGTSLSNYLSIGSGGGTGGTSGNGCAGGVGGAGGGAVYIITHDFNLNGTISSDGATGAKGCNTGTYYSGSGGGGGGSGGSVIVSVSGSLSGTGTVSANGGSGGGGGPNGANGPAGGTGGTGSGGRIGITYGSSTFTGSYSAHGSGAGTIFTQASGTNGDLLLSNNKVVGTPTIVPGSNNIYDHLTATQGALLEIPSSSVVTANAIGAAAGTGTSSGNITIDSGGTWNIPASVTLTGYVVTNNGTLTGGNTALSLASTTWNQNGTSFPSGTSLTVGASSIITFTNTMTPTQALNLNSLTVQSGGTITAAANTTTAASTLNFNVTQPVDIQSGGTINLDGKGYSTGNGSGKPVSGNAGGSYGGVGGVGNTAGTTAGVTYDDQAGPTDMGSGGSAGAGGGALQLVSQGAINVDGTITANGGATNGSGGSIWLTGTTITGAGTITANGAGSGATVGGGAGGRIAFTYTGDPLSLDPLNGATGDRSGGDTLTLTGSNFSAGTKVLIGGVNATTTFIDDHTLSVIVPATNAPQTVDVTVYDQTFTGAETVTGATGYTAGGDGTIYPAEMPGSQTATQAQSYTYTQANPVISSVSPTVGPITGGNNVLISGQAFDSFGRDGNLPATANAWVNTSKTLPVAVRGAASAVIGNTIYLFGGFTTSSSTATNTIYSASTSAPTTWTNTGKTLPSNLGWSSLAVVGSKLYLFGGSTSTTTSATNAIYSANISDPTTWTIVNGKTLPANLTGAAFTVAGNSMYLIGGANGSSAVDTIYTASLSDPTTWTLSANKLPVALLNTTIATAGNSLYLYGGSTNYGSANAANTIYTASLSDPTTWSNTGSTLPTNIAAARLVTLGNTMYFIGGINSSSTSLNTVYQASMSNPTTWTSAGTLPAGLTDMPSVIVNGNIYLLGGYSSTTSAPTNVIYSAPLTATGTDYYNLPWQTDLTKPVSRVLFGDTTATNIEYINSSSLIATTPAHAAGTVDVIVSDTTGQTSTLSNSYTYTAPATLSSLTPASEPLTGGDTITLSGSGFATGDSVTVNGVSATSVTVVNGTTLTFTAPVGVQIGSASVTVVDSLGQSSNTVSLTYTLPTPTLSSIAPNSGPTIGSQNVTVNGSGFYAPNSNSNSLTNAGTLPITPNDGATAIIGDHIYIFGGSINATATGTNTIYSAPVSDPTNWTNTGKTLPAALIYQMMAVIGDHVYIFGGHSGSSSVATIYSAPVSDPTNWTNTGKTLPAALESAQTAVVGDKVYIFGGSGSTAIYSAPVSDPTSWTQVGALPTTIALSAIQQVGNKIYLFGGAVGSSGAANTIYAADVSDPTSWSQVGTIPAKLWASSVTVVGNTVYLIGGYSGSAGVNTIYSAPVSDPTNWTNTGKTLSTPVFSGSKPMLIDGSMYIFGGETNVIFKTAVTHTFPNQYNPAWTTNWNTDPTGNYTYSLTLGGSPATNVRVTNGTTLTANTPAGTGTVDVQAATYSGNTSNVLASAYTYTSPKITSVSPTSGPTNGNQNVVISGQNFNDFGNASTTPALATSQTWTKATGTMPVATKSAMTAIVGNTIYSFGGLGSNGAVSNISSAPTSDPTNWSSVGNLPIPLAQGKIVVLGNKMYIFGGANGTDLDTIYSASVDNPTVWTDTGKKLPGSLAASSVVIANGNIYLLGGHTGATVPTNVIYYAPLSDPTNWYDTGKTIPATLNNAAVITSGNKIYLLGGKTDSAVSTNVNTIYSAPTSDPTSWSLAGTLPTTLSVAGSVVVGNTAYLLGGVIADNVMNTTVYAASMSDLTTWTSDGTLNTATYSPGVIIANNALYLLGGSSASAPITTIQSRPLSQVDTDYSNYPWISNLPSPVSNVTFGGTNATKVEYLGTDTLVATTPAHTAGTVDVVASDTTGQTSTLSNSYTYVAPATLSGVSPSTEPLAGGDTITLTGTGFVAGDTITVNSVPATNVTVLNSTTLTFTAPVGAQIGAASVVVTDPLNQTSNSIMLTYTLPTPTLSSITPNTGPTTGNQSVTVSGSGLYTPNSTTNVWTNTGATLPAGTDAAQVAVIGNYVYLFGGSSSNTIYRTSANNPTNWTNTGATLPAGLYGAKLYEAGNTLYLFGGGTNGIYQASTSDPTTWTNTGKTLPGSAKNQVMATINGYIYLYGGSDTNVIYQASTSDPTTWTNTGKTLPVDLAYSSAAVIGNTIYFFGGWSYPSPLGNPTIYSAPVSDPTTVTSTGKSLPGTLYGSSMAVIGNTIYMFGGMSDKSGGASSAIYQASTSDPTTWTNTGKTLPAGLHTSQVAAIDGYLYLFGGSTSGWSTPTNVIYKTPVTETFPNQYNPSWTTNWNTDATTDYSYKLALGGTAATNVTLASASTLTATTAAHGAGTVDVVVSNDAASNATLANSYTYIAPPTVTGFTPSSEMIGTAGDTITITGSDFTSGATVSFGGVSATVLSVTNNTITATIPTGTAVDRVTITVTNPDGQSADAPGKFAYTLAAPVITSITPNKGPMAGNTNVTVNGSGFLSPNSATNSWTASSKTLPSNLSASSVAVIGNTIYAFGGRTASSTFTNAIYTASVSDPTSWTNTGKTLPSPLGFSSLAVVGDTVYLFAGKTSGAAYTNVIYSAPVSDPTSWTNTGKTLPSTLFASSLAIIDGNIYLYGGMQDNSTYLNTIYTASVSDPTSWTTITGKTLPGGIALQSIATIGNKLYLYGGQTSASTYANVIWSADASDPTVWTDTGKTLPTALQGTALTTIGNDMYLIGGGNSSIANTIYTAKTNDPTTWTNSGTTLPSALENTTTLAIGNALYIFGGSKGSTDTNAIYTSLVTHTFPNQYNQPWTTNWYTDSSDQRYSLTLDGTQVTNVVATSASTLTATTPAHAPAATDAQVTTYDGNKSNVLANAYTYYPDAYAFTNDPITIMARQPGKVTIEMRDADGNPVTSEDDVTLQLSTSTNTGSFSASQDGPWNLMSVTIPAGQSSADVYYHDTAKGAPTLTVTDPLGTTATQDETITSAYKILVTGVSDPTNVGVPSSLTVQAVDWQGVPQSDYRGTVHFTSTDGAASLPTDYTFTAADFGRHTFTNGIAFGTQGTWDVTATDQTDSSITGSQTGVVVGPPSLGTVAQLAFTTPEQSFPLDGTSGVMTVQMEDSTGTPLTRDSDTTVYLRTDSATGQFSADDGATWQDAPLAVTIPANRSSVNFLYRDTTAGTHNLKVSQDSDDDFGWQVAQQPVVVGVGKPSAIKLDDSVDNTVSAGEWVPLTVGLGDTQANAVSAPADTPIHLTSTSGGYLSASSDGSQAGDSLDVVVPVGTQYVTVYVQVQTGPVTITGTDGRPLGDDDTAYTPAELDLASIAAAPYKVGLVPENWDENTQHGSQQVHTTQKMTVTLYDLYGNVAIATNDTQVALSSDINSGATDNTGFFGLTDTSATNPTFTATVANGTSTQEVYYQQNVVHYGTALTADSTDLESGTLIDDVKPGPYAGKLLWVNPNDSRTSDEALVNDPAAFAKFIASSSDYPKTLQAKAGVAQELKVYLADQWGNPTAATSDVTIGVAGSNTAKNSDDTAKAVWGTSASGPWNDMVVSPSPYKNSAAHPVSLTATIPAATADPATDIAAPSFADLYYEDDVAATPTISVIDTAASHWHGACTSYWGDTCLSTTYTNDTLNTTAITVNPGPPSGYKIMSDPQIISTNTPSSPITIELVDKFGNETTGDSDITATMNTTSTTGQFSLNGTAWQNDNTDVTFPAGVSQTTVYYKDSTISPTDGYTITIGTSDNDMNDADKDLVSDTQKLRTILGIPNRDYLDLGGVATATAGDCTPVTLVTTTTVNGQDMPAVVLADTPFSLSPSSKDNGFYTNGSCTSGTEVTSATVAKDTDSVQLYVKFNTSGTKSLNATSSGFTVGTTNPQNIMPAQLAITAAGVYKLGFSTLPSSFVVGRNSGNMAVSTEDQFGNIVVSGANRSVAVTSSAAGGTFTGGDNEFDTTIAANGATTTTFTYTNGAFDTHGNLVDRTALGAQTLTAHTDNLTDGTGSITGAGTYPTSVRYIDENGDQVPLSKIAVVAGDVKTVYLEYLAADGLPAIAPKDIPASMSTTELGSSSNFSADHGDDILNGTDLTQVGSYSLIVPKDYASAKLTITAQTAKNHQLTATGDFYDDNNNLHMPKANLEIDVIAGAPNGLKATGSVQTIHPQIPGTADADAMSQAINVYLIDKYGNYTSDQTSHDITLSSSCATGHFLSAAQSSSQTTTVTIGAGQQSTATWYQDSTAYADPCTMTFASGGLVSGSQDINVIERTTALKLESADTVEAGAQLATTVTALDRFGNVVPVTDNALKLNLSSDGSNNTFTPNPATIAIGNTTASVTFTHTAALTESTDYTLTAADASQAIPSASKVVTVTPGTPAGLKWVATNNTYTGTVGDYLPVKLQVVNAAGLATPATENMDISLTNGAGTNAVSGQQAGNFYADAGGQNNTQDVEIAAGSTATATFFYQQTVTSHDKYWYDSYQSVHWIDKDYPTSIMANYGTLSGATGAVSVKPLTLHFATAAGATEVNTSIQARSCKAMTITIDKAMPFDQTFDLKTTAAAGQGSFYSSCVTPPGQPDSAMTGQITTVTIPANQTKSAVFYYHQTQLSDFAILSGVTDPSGSINPQSWSASDAVETVGTFLGNVDHLTFVNPNGSSDTDLASLAQNQPGKYVIEARDSLDNPTPFIPAYYAGTTCLYVKVDDSAGKLSTSESGSCPQYAGSVAIAMTGGETQGHFTYSDMTLGTHTLTASTNSTGTGTIHGNKAVTITPATTTHLSFDEPVYPLIRGSQTNVTVKLAGDYEAVVNTVGDTQVTLGSTSSTGEWRDPATGDWVKTLTTTIPADQTSVTLSYRDDDAGLGSYDITASADGLTAATATMALTTGTYSGITFENTPQTLELQQPGAFTVALTDEGGNEVTAASDQCIYITAPSTTASFTADDPSESCADRSLSDGTTAYGIVVRAADTTASFTLTDTTPGSYDVTASTNPSAPSQGLIATQTVTFVNGDPAIATLAKDSYDMERGDTLTTKVVLRNAYGAIVPATENGYFRLSSSSVSGQFALNTDDPMEATLTIFIAAGSTGTNIVYGDSDPQIGTDHITVHHVDEDGQDIPDDPLVDSDTPINVVYGQVAALAFTNDPRTTIATHPSQVMTVELQNQFGYPTVNDTPLTVYFTGDSSTADFALSDDGPWGIASATVPAGSSSINVYYRDSTEGVHQISAVSQLSDDQGTVALEADQQHTIIRQTMDHFVVTNISTPQQAGTPSSVVVFAVDSEGYVVNWYTGTIHFSADSGDAVYPTSDYTFTPADKGIHTFTNSIAFKQSGTKAITVTDDNGLTGTQYDIVVGNPNTNPVHSIAFIEPQPQPVNGLKNVPTDQMVLQLRDSAGTPTTAAAAGGLPIRLTSDSPTGQFATDPAGPWSSTLDVTVAQGLSYTTTPLYYRDSAGGQHTITAADWQGAADDPAILNGALAVHIDEFTVGTRTTLYSKDYSGTMRQNYYLFSNSKSGGIEGYGKLQLTATSINTGDSVAADWNMALTGGRGNTIDRPSFSQQATIQYQTPTLTPVRTDGDYTVATTLTAGQLTGSSSTILPVSPWLAVFSDVAYSNQTIQAKLLTYKGGNLADVPYGDIIVPGTGTTWSFASLKQNGQLSHASTGSYTFNIPLTQPLSGDDKLVASLRDPFGIIAQDSTPLNGTTSPVTVAPAAPAAQPAAPAAPEPVAPAVTSSRPAPAAPQPSSPLKRFLRSPQAPTIVSGALFGLLLLVAIILIYQAYKEWQRSNRLAAIVARNNQLVGDKTQFLALAAHHLRTPITIIRGGVELMSALAAKSEKPPVASQRLEALAGHLRDRIEQIIAEVDASPDLAEIQEVNPRLSRLKVVLSPMFWMPVILSVILTQIANWAIRTYGGRTISATQTLNQVFFILLGVVVAYTSVRLLYMRRERRRLLAETEARIVAFNTAKTRFVHRVYGSLSDDVLQADALLQEQHDQLPESVQHTLVSGIEHLKRLVSRFALLDSVYQLAPVRNDFNVSYAVEDALYELEIGPQNISGMHVTNNAGDLHVYQDRRLVSKVFETILASMCPSDGKGEITIDGAENKDDQVALTISGPGTDAPAESLFGVYSSSQNETAGTLGNDNDVHRLDLYLDRIIVNALGGSISAEKHGGSLKVALQLPVA